MSKRYKIEKVENGRWAVWYMEIPNSKSKLGVWKIIDLFTSTRETRFAFRKRVKGTEKTQEQLDEQILSGAIRRFYRKNIYMGNHVEQQKGV